MLKFNTSLLDGMYYECTNLNTSYVKVQYAFSTAPLYLANI